MLSVICEIYCELADIDIYLVSTKHTKREEERKRKASGV